jgi:protein-tyrosine phosphatase
VLEKFVFGPSEENILRSLMMIDRQIQLSATFNTRDLGGMTTSSNRLTRFRSILRSDSLDLLTSNDWEKLASYGVRTLIDLRNENEITRRIWPREFVRVHIPLDGGNDPFFWAKWKDTGNWCTPLYYRAHLERFPDLSASVIRAIAEANDGGVLFHCGAGRDRTGLIAIILLHLAGVNAKEISADHYLSYDNLTKLHQHRGSKDERTFIEKTMLAAGKTTHDVITDILSEVDICSLLTANGCSKSHIRLIESRLG